MGFFFLVFIVFFFFFLSRLASIFRPFEINFLLPFLFLIGILTLIFLIRKLFYTPSHHRTAPYHHCLPTSKISTDPMMANFASDAAQKVYNRRTRVQHSHPKPPAHARTVFTPDMHHILV